MKTKITHLYTNLLFMPAIVGFAAFLIGGCAPMTTAPNVPPSGTIRITEWSAAYYGSAAIGKGTLHYNGQRHHFTISGLGAGGMGGQKVSAAGRVYNLNSLANFPGTFSGVSRGLTLINGQMHARLTNENGVVMYLAGDTEGLAASIGVQAFVITLID